MHSLYSSSLDSNSSILFTGARLVILFASGVLFLPTFFKNQQEKKGLIVSPAKPNRKRGSRPSGTIKSNGDSHDNRFHNESFHPRDEDEEKKVIHEYERTKRKERKGVGNGVPLDSQETRRIFDAWLT